MKYIVDYYSLRNHFPERFFDDFYKFPEAVATTKKAWHPRTQPLPRTSFRCSLLGWSRKFTFRAMKEEDKVTGLQTPFQHCPGLTSYCWTRLSLYDSRFTRNYITAICCTIIELVTTKRRRMNFCYWVIFVCLISNFPCNKTSSRELSRDCLRLKDDSANRLKITA